MAIFVSKSGAEARLRFYHAGKKFWKVIVNSRTFDKKKLIPTGFLRMDKRFTAKQEDKYDYLFYKITRGGGGGALIFAK
jgi:hypothetical protein